MIIAGIDYSYTSPAITLIDTEKEFIFENFQIFSIYEERRKTKTNEGLYGNLTIDAIKPYFSQEERFDLLLQWSSEKLKDIDIAYLEGYSYNSTGRIFDIAENTSCLKNWLYKNKKEFHIISPSMQKKAFVGKGNAKKTQSVDRFVEFLGVDLSEIIGLPNKYSKPIDDIVDSVSVLYYGYMETNKKKNAKTK